MKRSPSRRSSPTLEPRSKLSKELEAAQRTRISGTPRLRRDGMSEIARSVERTSAPPDAAERRALGVFVPPGARPRRSLKA